MIILSFARTTAALVARQKTVTRREWSDPYFARMKKALDAAIASGDKGLLAQAWSASPHRKGRKVGTILITSLTREETTTIPDSDWEAEGFAYMVKHGLNLGKEIDCHLMWETWRETPGLVTAVVRFEVVSIEEGIATEHFFPGATA